MRLASLRPAVLALAALLASSTVSGAQTLEELVLGAGSEARTAWQRGAYDEALEALGGADQLAALALRAVVLAETGEYREAIRVVGGVEGPAPSPALERLRGELLLGVGERDAARAAFEASLAADGPDAPVARLRLAEMAMYTAGRDGAFEVFDSFIDFYNSGRAGTADELMAVGTAVAYLARTNSDLMQDALRAFDEAAAVSPNYAAPRIALGDLFRTTYQTTDAYAEYAAVLGRNPGHPDALVGRARAQHFDGDPEAMLTARRALETNPNHPDALAFIARLTLEAEGNRDARELAEDALEVNPTHLEALSVLAAIHFLAEDDAAFDAVLARVDAFAPGYGELHGLVAELAVSHRKYAEAIELGRTALARDPGLHAVRGRMGMTMLRLGDIDAGRREVERAFEGDPFNPWFKNTLDLADKWADFTTLKTEHFEILLPTREADLLGPLVEATAEAAWDGLVARYAYEPPTPVRVELYPSSADFSVRALGLAGLGALGVSFGPVLVMDSPSARPAGEFNWRSVLWHELAHTFHLEFTEHEVPRWFSEGLAMREQRVEDDRWGFKPSVTFFQAYEAGDMPALSNLTEGLVRPRFPGQVGLTYLEASYVFDWIEERWGFDTIRAFLEGYRDDRTTEQLVDDLLGMGMEEADEAFDLYLRERFEREFVATAEERDDGAMEDAAGGDLLFGDRTDEGSIRLLQSAVESFPENFRLRLALGQTLLGAERLDEAETQLREALRLFPSFPEEGGPLWGLAEIHEARGETRKAADALRRLGYLGETQWAAPRREAELRRELGDLEGEIDALRRAAEVFPFERDLQLRRAEVAEAAAEATEWVRARRAVLALDPVDRAEAHFQLARALQAAGRTSEARTQVLRALEIAPTFEAALELLLELRGSA